jgi:hypothetical protein
MRQLSFIALAGFLALFANGCATDTSVAPSPSPVEVPSPAAQPPTKPFAAKPLVAQKPGGASAVSGLIQPTNPDERARQVQAGITTRQTARDPFSILPPVITGRAPISAPARRVTSVPNLPRLPRPSGNAGRQFNPGSGNLFPPGSTPSLPQAPPITALPPLPEPDLARSVQVTGVVRVGGVNQAIVIAPNEPTTRYVRVGQRLSNGQVLVKRIDLNQGADPVVILEQNGVEVSKAVGEAPAGGENQQAQVPQETTISANLPQ